MKYRQWKKNYKKLHGVNPPLELDKRKQRRLAKKAVKTIRLVDFTAGAPSHKSGRGTYKRFCICNAGAGRCF